MSRKAKGWISVAGVVLVVGSCQNAFNGDQQPAAYSTPSTTTTASPASGQAAAAAPAAAPAPEPEPAGEVITVARVIDGDTFETGDGRTIRLLGIDSCEMSTYGGKEAKRAAEGQFDLMRTMKRPITMTAEPTGDDKDRDGRFLRYVQLGGDDFGEHMVRYDHTGVYQGEHDASEEYVQRLYAKDTELALNPPSGRECSDPYPSSSSGGSVDVDNDDDHNGRDGSIIPACARKWWC